MNHTIRALLKQAHALYADPHLRKAWLRIKLQHPTLRPKVPIATFPTTIPRGNNYYGR